MAISEVGVIASMQDDETTKSCNGLDGDEETEEEEKVAQTRKKRSDLSGKEIKPEFQGEYSRHRWVKNSVEETEHKAEEARSYKNIIDSSRF